MSRQSQSFSFTREQVDTYTMGYCWLLATTLEHMMGWPVALVTAENDPDTNWRHVVNRLPNGLLVDIEGVRKDEELLSQWRRMSSLVDTVTAPVSRGKALPSESIAEHASAAAVQDLHEIAQGIIALVTSA